MTSAVVRPLAVKLDQDIRDRIKRLAEARNRTTHWVMREAVQQYVEREEQREAYRQQGVQAWAQYQSTGQHVTLEEADAWLARLEAGQDEPPPECHG